MTMVLASSTSPANNTNTAHHAMEALPNIFRGQQPQNSQEELLERELEAEICQRFVRLSCEKMMASRNSRGGARLHRNLLILHLLRKARYNTKMLPYECSSLLKRSPASPFLNSHRFAPSSIVPKTEKPIETTSSLIVYDQNQNIQVEEDQQENEFEECGPLLHHAPRVSRPLFPAEDDDQPLEEEEVELDVELDFQQEEDSSTPMEDVNMKINKHIHAQTAPEMEEDEEAVEDEVELEVQKEEQLPIGGHLRRSIPSTLFSEVSKEQQASVGFVSQRRQSSKFSSSSSAFFSFSSSSVNYGEPLEYKVHDHEEKKQHDQQQQYLLRQNHEDYGFLDFSKSSKSSKSSSERSSDFYSSHSHPSSPSSEPHFSSFVQNEEEFQRQQRRHFSGRLYERCNFSRFQSQTHHQSNASNKIASRREEMRQSILTPFNAHFSLGLVGSAPRLHSPSKWPRREEEEAFEEGTDVAAQLEENHAPPLPLRSSSDWLRNQFHHNTPALNIIQTSHPSIDQSHPHPSHNDESPPQMFYCSPPSSPLLAESKEEPPLFSYSDDEEEGEDHADGHLYDHYEEGFFEEEEEEGDEDEEDGDEKLHSTVRKRKTTANGAGRLAVLEKRPCCNGEQKEEYHSSNCPSDSDSGVDVSLGCPSDKDFPISANDHHHHHPKAQKESQEDQTVPVAVFMNTTPMVFL